jgi:hypothetical protein
MPLDKGHTEDVRYLFLAPHKNLWVEKGSRNLKA